MLLQLLLLLLLRLAASAAAAANFHAGNRLLLPALLEQICLNNLRDDSECIQFTWTSRG
jgi:hypothetical protein